MEILQGIPTAGSSQPLQGPQLTSDKAQAHNGNFADFLSESIDAVNQQQMEADNAIQDLATGNGGSIHDTMIAMEKASISFELMVQVRNKIVSAYQEIMRMPV